MKTLTIDYALYNQEKVEAQKRCYQQTMATAKGLIKIDQKTFKDFYDDAIQYNDKPMMEFLEELHPAMFDEYTRQSKEASNKAMQEAKKFFFGSRFTEDEIPF